MERNIHPDIKELKVHTLGFDVGLFHRAYISDRVSIIPGALIGWGSTKAKYDGYEDEKTSAVIGGFQTSLLIDQFHLTPSVQFSKGTTAFNLLIGFIFPNQ